ncbi:M48 family metalloprotease [Paenibacillus sp. N1-5-1-14]|uniref:M56 family metallopeptidase n=1 Tax=Paenibacillus radicibacter TaxID=2972488 RepID=UPI002158CC49|nr:M56 family metallopeptidase [Paenibacillus radicibacter]MCR8644007.1 M48 family metalloprotease [Paenibacillus radicibacter]
MSELWEWVLLTSVMGTVLAGIILAARWVLRTKLTPNWHYMLWMLLIVRLLLPWTPESPLSVFNLLSSHDVQKVDLSSQIDKANSIHYADPNLDPAVARQHERQKSNSTRKEIEDGQAETFDFTWLEITGLIWIAGVLVLSGKTILSTYLWNRNMRRTKILTPSHEVYQMYMQVKEELGIRRSIPILISDQLKTPALSGWMRPRIVMPASLMDTLSVEEIRHIMIHELMHAKRHDIAINWIMHGLLIVHWFNPILWLASARMREDQETSCDARVLRYIRPEQSLAYAHTLIKLIEHNAKPKRAVGITPITGTKQQLLRRLTLIKQNHKYNRSLKWSILGLTVVILISVLALTNAKSGWLSTSISKDEVRELMRNSVDRFAGLQGSFTNTEGELIEFKVLQGDRPFSYVKKGNIETIYKLYHSYTRENGEYTNIRSFLEPAGRPTPKKYPVLPDVPRRDQAKSGLAEPIVAPEYAAVDYLKDDTLWSIQDETSMLGRSVIRIGGELPNDMKAKLQAYQFTMWIDKETGVLLKREVMDTSGKITPEITVQEIDFNSNFEPLDYFVLTADEYNELGQKFLPIKVEPFFN